MTKRTRISKKAQARRRKDFELGALFDQHFNTFYGLGYYYTNAQGQRWGLDGVDRAPGDAGYIKAPDGTVFPELPTAQTLRNAVYGVQGETVFNLHEKRIVLANHIARVLDHAARNTGVTVYPAYKEIKP